MSKLSETYKGWKESGMSGRGNTDAIIHAIVEELLKNESPEPIKKEETGTPTKKK